ncbi:lysozyme family protein [Allocoprobacillus halotolerans]|uniref:Lysozyme family protein n=1 Tax=Allocoprobacillus halotolerans TaxID=2944914 RepID=A0ABY5I5H4_9FIRM|nr:lysozyme family protein [Allocoprobacillus halotolerans]UTY39466.1 lysozyme family protein [Allocoprobacillus halotolerans]
MNEIKKKTKNREIKSKDKIVDVRKHIKNIAIHSKDNSNADEKETQNTYAVDHVSKKGKKAINNVKEQSIKNAKKQYTKRKENKIIERQIQNVYTPTPPSSSQHKSDKTVSENNSLNKRKTVQKDLKIKKDSKSLPIKNKNIVIKKETANQKTYQHKIKSFVKLKNYKQIKDSSKNSNRIKKGTQSAMKTLKGSLIFIKRTALSVSNLVGAGISLILLLVLLLFIGVFAALSDNSSVSSTNAPLSVEVLAYTDTIEKYAKQYEMEDYIPIIQAVMMQESGGKGTDPMQSSECPYNTKYPNKPNAIQEPEYSIDVGIHYLSDCFKSAQVKDSFDNEHIFLALQGYNYGNGYIDWAVKNFGGYSKANAKVFSDQKKAELGTDVYGDPNYVEHVMRYVSLGFGNYREQPNFDNMDAWGTNNPYSRANLYGQCTWFAWGRFYEIYGYSPGFIGDGWKCVDQLLQAHPDKFIKSNEPAVGAVFSCIGRNHVGIVIGWDGENITIQEGNLDGLTNTFAEAKKDWHTATYSLDQFRTKCKGVVFAVPK